MQFNNSILFEIIIIKNSDWFKQKPSDVEALQSELALERQIRMRLEKRLESAERGRKLAERERDLYKVYEISWLIQNNNNF